MFVRPYESAIAGYVDFRGENDVLFSVNADSLFDGEGNYFDLTNLRPYVAPRRRKFA